MSLVSAAERRLAAMASRMARTLGAEVRRAAPVGRRTPGSRRTPGQLRRSIRATGSYRAGVVSVVVTSTVIQAATTEYGARPHVIRPRRRKVLRFHSPSRSTRADGFVFRRRVDHPGNRARPWLRPTLRRWPELVRAELTRS